MAAVEARRQMGMVVHLAGHVAATVAAEAAVAVQEEAMSKAAQMAVTGAVLVVVATGQGIRHKPGTCNAHSWRGCYWNTKKDMTRNCSRSQRLKSML